MEKYITRRKVLDNACHEIIREMYFRAQPPIDINVYIEQYKNGTLDKNKDNCYEWHYLPLEIQNQIIEDYINAYGAQDWLKYSSEFFLNNFKKGGRRTVYKDIFNIGEKTRSSEETEKLDELIGKENAEKVYKLIDDYLNFYRANYDENLLRSVIFQCPTSNPKTVIEKWGPNFKIDDSVYKGYDGEMWDYTYKDYYNGEYYGEVDEDNE